MATPDGRWTVAVIHAYGGREVFRVRERAIIGARGGVGWAPIGKIRRTVAEVAEVLGENFVEVIQALAPVIIGLLSAVVRSASTSHMGGAA